MEKQSLPSSPIVGKRIAKNLKTIKKLNEVNNIITCYLCRGYLIEPTAINECLHLCKYDGKHKKYLFFNLNKLS